ncbi:hypothetical protein [Streptomyces sp. NRRL B-24572]|uniref:hypothetical protein n=1 Tax=Streptomyces sp. NRRL B-24572 TaxID=1962156 RepID=UPI000A3B50D0|nr:hypothetical protein [Streptomyces sp. NRRL B-24572]
MTDADSQEPPDEDSFAERLDFLCTNDPRGPFTNPQVVRMLGELGMPAPSSTYIWQLRTGRSDNPTKKTMDALADLFGVPRDYWASDTTTAAVNAMIVRLNGLKATGATPEQLHQQLRNFTKRMGQGVNPETMVEQLETLARLSEAGVTAATLERLKDSRVTNIAMRAVGLSDQGLNAAAAIIEQVRQLEGLPAAEPPAPAGT